MLEAKYTCPRCGKLNAKSIYYSKITVPIDSYFRCPYCEANIKMRYVFGYKPGGPTVHIVDIGAYNPNPVEIVLQEEDSDESYNDEEGYNV